jgi:hypothetical protein
MMTYVKLAFGQLRWLSSTDCIGEWAVFCLRVWCTWVSRGCPNVQSLRVVNRSVID